MSPEDAMLNELLPLAEKAAALLKERRETIAVAESSTGGLIAAALLAVPGASAYFLGGAVVYTHAARTALLAIPDEALSGMRASTEPYALLLARTARERFAASWGLSESGATGHSCLALAGASERAITLETGDADRLRNMQAFAAAGLELLLQGLAR